MFRSESDINYAFNCFALACWETESRPLADSEMTTHSHFGVCTDNARQLFSQFRYPYSRYFNNKYGRTGRLGEREAFFLEVDGLMHSQALLSYICRQGLHHGLSDSAFGYRHNSVNAIFRNVLGKGSLPDILPRTQMGRYLPRTHRDVPDGYRMDCNGLLLREDVIDTTYVEELYLSPRNFLYQMNRLSSEQWRNEQEEDGNGLPPVSLESLEPAYFKPSMSQLLLNESGRNFTNRISDLELCKLIDNVYVKRLGLRSIYELSENGRKNLGNGLYSDFRSGKISVLLGRNSGFADVGQIRRCAAIKP